MKRIFINKNDGIAEIVENIINDADLDITLVIPKNALIGESVSNFRLLKREADTANKNLRIESVDDDILASAKASHLPSIHPLFKTKKIRGGVSDIVTAEEEDLPQTQAQPEHKNLQEVISGNEEEESGEYFHETPEESVIQEVSPQKKRWFFRPKFLIILGALLIVLIGGFFVAGALRKAEVFVNFEELPWGYEDKFLATAATTELNSETNIFPAEIFTEDKNITETFPASGKDYVSHKATGKILIYNAYSSEPQALVATTRFISEDGKLFRLNTAVTVPGAEIKDGKIIPASIEANVTADKAGGESNLTGGERLSIPGFKGSPKYEGFYGELIKTSGGFIGEKSVPTNAEIESAKEKTKDLLISNLESSFLNNRPKGFKILDDAIKTEIIGLSVNTNTDDQGNFSVFGEAKLQAIGFKESDLEKLLVAIASPDSTDLIFKSINLEFKDVSASIDGGELRFSLTVDGTLTQAFIKEDFANQIINKDIDDVRNLVSNLPRLTDAKISLWPRWLKRFPSDTSRINITVD